MSTFLPVSSSLLLSGSKGTSHVLLHVPMVGGSGTEYDGMADLVTDGTLRRPRGCLLTGHTRYTRNTVILCFRFRHSDQTPPPPSGPFHWYVYHWYTLWVSGRLLHMVLMSLNSSNKRIDIIPWYQSCKALHGAYAEGLPWWKQSRHSCAEYQPKFKLCQFPTEDVNTGENPDLYEMQKCV